MDGNIEKMQSLTGRIKGLGIDKTLTKKGMCAEAEATGKALATKVSITDIVDDLLSVASDKPLSANQGRLLKKLIDEIDPHYAENVLYNDTNVKDALDKVSKAENIAYDGEKSVQGAIDELKSLVCNVEKIRVNQVFTSSTTGIECWSYTAKRRCLLNVTVTFGNYSGKATDVKAYISSVDSAVVNHRNTGDDQSHLVMPISVCLEKGEKLTTYSTYNNATQNRYIVEGYVQYLE